MEYEKNFFPIPPHWLPPRNPPIFPNDISPYIRTLFVIDFYDILHNYEQMPDYENISNYITIITPPGIFFSPCILKKIRINFVLIYKEYFSEIFKNYKIFYNYYSPPFSRMEWIEMILDLHCIMGLSNH
jgi:hypothetical protein